MGNCLHGNDEVKKGKAKFKCAKCGALASKKSHLCKPTKFKKKK
jgi:hypothetical protein